MRIGVEADRLGGLGEVAVVRQDRTTTTSNVVGIGLTFPLSDNTTYMIEAYVVARRTGGAAGTAGDGASYIRVGTFRRQGGGGSTQIGATSSVHTTESQAGWDVTLVANGNDVEVQVLGATDNDVTWRTVVVAYAVSS